MKRALSLGLTAIAIAGSTLLGTASAATAETVLTSTTLTTGTTGTVAASTVTTAAATPADVTAVALAAAPDGPDGPKGQGNDGGGSITIDLDGATGKNGKNKPSQSIIIMLGLTVLSVAPAILLLCTSFTKIFVVLSLTRNALGLQSVPPNQVLAGLALFLSLFIMGPVMSDVNDKGVQPYLKGDKTASQAIEAGTPPVREFLLKQTRKDEIALFTKISKSEKPANATEVPMTTLIPAFVLSELRAAFLIGFIIFVPFLVIDMVVSASLMAMGMMMLPPVTVALPFKLLLFVLVNGWGLIVTALVASYN